MPTPLHNHTHYSRLDGLATPEQIVKRCQEVNFEACCITDHDYVAGHLDFYKTLSKNEMKPLLGIETYQAPSYLPRTQHEKSQSKVDELGEKQKLDNFHLILIAQNDEGLRNLWAMNTESHRSGFYYHGRVDWDLLKQFNKGIVSTSGCALSLVSSLISKGDEEEAIKTLYKYAQIFKDRFYVELGTYQEQFQYDLNIKLVQLAQELGLPLVYGNDAHYASPDDYELHETILAVQYGEKIKNTLLADNPHHVPCLYIMSEDEVRDSLSYLPASAVEEALKNSDVIAEQCNVQLPERKNHVPVFVPDVEYENSWEMFFDLVVEGYNEKVSEKGLDSEDYRSRLQMEMEVMRSANLYDYFLIVRDFIDFARRDGTMVGPGRGSVGGSLVAWLIGITEVDPIRYGLIFERFYNAGREKSLPDIDIDFSNEGRERVKAYARKKYGERYVSDLGTHVRLKSAGAITDMSRAMGISLQVTSEISHLLEKTIKSGLQAKWPKIWEEIGDKLEPYNEKYPQLFDYAERLYDHVRSYSVHASGIVVSSDVLDDILPLRWVASDKKLVSQWDYRTADDLGFMKIDFLGLTTMDILDEVNHVLAEEGKELINYPELHYLDHPTEMWELMDRGLTTGIFQIEEGGLARNLVKEMKPRSLEDLCLLLAVNRPGPGLDAFVRYMKGRRGEDREIIHPFVEEATKETYGEFIYQEQIIDYFRLLGYSAQEADWIRKIVGKKLTDEMDKEFPRYLERATQHMDEAIAQTIWNGIVRFSEYGFNKSHSLAYAIITLRTLYVKYHYPAQFILAAIRVLSRQKAKKKDKIVYFIEEAQRMGLEILHPDINRSNVEMKTDGNGIRYGFINIKGFGKQPSEWICKWRPFLTPEEMLERAQDEDTKITLPNGTRRVGINKSQVEYLRYLGAFGPSPLDDEDLMALEEELLGVAISDKSAKILHEHKTLIDENCTPISEIEDDGEYYVAGVIKTIEEAESKNGNTYYKVTVENEIDRITFFVWNNTIKRLKFMLRRRVAGIFKIERYTYGENRRGLQLQDARPLFSRKNVDTRAA